MYTSSSPAKYTFTILALSIVGLSAFGCAATQAIENKIDCGSVCNRYKDCFKKDYDVDACKSRCESSAKTDQDYQNKLNTCSACIDNQSCTSAVFSCGGKCGAIVP